MQNFIKNIITLLFVIVLFAGCSDLGEEVELLPAEVRQALPTQEFKDVTIRHTNDGETSFIVRSPSVFRYDRTDTAILFGGIQVDFYKENKPSSYLTADSGMVLKGGREMRGIGNVVIRTDSGMVIQTPRMSWTERERLIRTDTTVLVTTQWDTIQGTGMIASDDLKTRRILNPKSVSRRNLSEAKKKNDNYRKDHSSTDNDQTATTNEEEKKPGPNPMDMGEATKAKSSEDQ